MSNFFRHRPDCIYLLSCYGREIIDRQRMNNPPSPREHWFFQGSLYIGMRGKKSCKRTTRRSRSLKDKKRRLLLKHLHQTHPPRFPRQIATHVSVVYVYHYNEISCYIRADISLYVLSASNRYKRVRFVGKASFLNVVFCNFLINIDVKPFRAHLLARCRCGFKTRVVL